MSSKLLVGRNRQVAMSSSGARAGAGSTRGRFRSEDLSLPPGGSETVSSTQCFKQLRHCPKALLQPRLWTGSAVLPILRPRSLNSLGFRVAPGRTFERIYVSFLNRAAFAIASKRFQNPFSGAGLSTFVSEGPIPASMI